MSDIKTHIVTREQLDKDNNYIGSVDLTNFIGHLRFDEELGCINFNSLKVSHSITFGFNNSATAKDSIEAGSDIFCELGIRAGGNILAGGNVEVRGDIVAGRSIRVGGDINTGGNIEANWEIRVGGDIKAYLGIEVSGDLIVGGNVEVRDGSIEARDFIEVAGGMVVSGAIIAGLTITCKFIDSGLRIFAGICSYKNPKREEMQIITQEVRRGIIAFGELIIKEKE